MNLYSRFQVEFGDAAKILFQDPRFALQLMLIADVLIMAAAAALEVRTPWFHSEWRSLQNCRHSASGKTGLLFEQRSFDAFALKNKGYEQRLARTVFIRRQPRQSVAAIDEFFDGELQAKILCY